SVFFFQAEDGIRDKLVTGVQTCALPISTERGSTWATPISSLERSSAFTLHESSTVPGSVWPRSSVSYKGTAVAWEPMAKSTAARRSTSRLGVDASRDGARHLRGSGPGFHPR